MLAKLDQLKYKLDPEFILWDKVGGKVEGKLVAEEKFIHRSGDSGRRYYIQTNEFEYVYFNGTTDLDTKMKFIEIGEWVEIILTDKRKIEGRDNKMKIFSVFTYSIS